jgi:cell wall-associated NlpC family hydrolase
MLSVVFALAACAGSPPRTASATPQFGSENADASRAADNALAMVGAPYRYGGVDPEGFDCSGLVHYSFRKIGISLPRDTHSLRKIGVQIDLNDLAKGDLVFFDQEGKKSSHVGIYLGDGRFVHAPSTGGKVRADKIDLTYWRKHFTEARRIRM